MSDELPDINVTRGEKALAAVLVVFLLIGGLWVYFTALPREADTAFREPLSAAQRQAIDAGRAADRRLADARMAQSRRERAYELAREDYRTDLDANTSTVRSRRAFVLARERLDRARGDLARAIEAANAARVPARRAEREVDRAR